MSRAYTWSNTSVKEKVGLYAGGLYAGELIRGEIQYHILHHFRTSELHLRKNP